MIKQTLKKKVILTGATGFVGANLCRYLLHHGCEVHILLRKESQLWRLKEIEREIYHHTVSLFDQHALSATLKQVKPEWIFHLAAYGAYSWQNDASTIIATNVLATVNLLEAATKIGFEAFVNTGSSSEYGFVKQKSNEETRLRPNSTYAVTKVAATHFCQLYAQKCRLYIPTIRLYSVYGPYEEPKRLMPTLMLALKRGSWPPLVDPEVARDFVYITDVCEAYMRVASSPQREQGAVFNVGTGTQTTIKQLVDLCAKEFKINAKPHWSTMPNRTWDTGIWIADIGKIKKTLAWQPQFSLRQGLSEFREWFDEHPEWLRFYEEQKKSYS